MFPASTIPASVLIRLEYLFTHIIPVLVIAITLANILSELGVIDRISWVIRPLVRFANLSPESGLAVITYVASGNAGSAMLAGFYENGVISERETIIASFVSSFFSFLNHVFVYFIPVVIPLLGLQAGLLYISARMFISLCVTITAAVAGHFMLSSPNVRSRTHSQNRSQADSSSSEDSRKSRNGKTGEKRAEKVRKGVKRSAKVLKKILPRLIVVYAVTAVLIAYNAFKPLENFRILSLPGQASAIVAAGIADTTSGFAAAGSLLASHVITPVQAVAALLLTSIVSMSVIFVRHSLPGRIAYFGFRLGLKIALISSALNIFYTSLVLLFLLH